MIGRAALKRITHLVRAELGGIAVDRAVSTRALLQNAHPTVNAAQRTSRRLSGQSAPSIAAAMFTAPAGAPAPAAAAAPPLRLSSAEQGPSPSQHRRADLSHRRR